jgi:outer membrane biogenesis lipoprotein LolB
MKLAAGWVQTRLIAATLLLTACSPAEPVTIDGSSTERFEQTAQQAREQLAPADRLAFDQALASISGRRHAADPDRLARTTFNGMTGAEIVADYRARQR